MTIPPSPQRAAGWSVYSATTRRRYVHGRGNAASRPHRVALSLYSACLFWGHTTCPECEINAFTAASSVLAARAARRRAPSPVSLISRSSRFVAIDPSRVAVIREWVRGHPGSPGSTARLILPRFRYEWIATVASVPYRGYTAARPTIIRSHYLDGRANRIHALSLYC